MRRVRSPELVTSFEMAQFDAENSRLDSIHPAIPPNHGVVIFANLAVIPKDPDLVLQLGVESHNCASFAERAKILTRVEAETGRVGKRANSTALVLSPVSLAGVLNNK
jgi:hypothetical protein